MYSTKYDLKKVAFNLERYRIVGSRQINTTEYVGASEIVNGHRYVPVLYNKVIAILLGNEMKR